MSIKKVIVVGAGIGGITAAAHLARNGLQVTVVEKNSRPGGRCDRFARAGHKFDTGPTLLVMPLVYQDEFARLGASIHDLLDLKQVDPTYHLVFDDGQRLALTADSRKMRHQLERIEPGGYEGFRRYMDEGSLHYSQAMSRLVNRDFRTATEFFTLENLSLLFRLKLLVNHYDNMGAYFDSPRLKAAFTFQDVYMGLSPFEAPAVFSMMPFTEMAHGVYYPMGGMYRLVEVLEELARGLGVEFVYGKAARQILVEGSLAQGVVLADGQVIYADAVVANADLPYVYQELLPDRRDARRVAS
ncbi:MAG: phytoene desaturase family protein, partial [Anaerolineales bacterium]|nr:phytoene desaturase family protein [Anaerolineales bacterium]